MNPYPWQDIADAAGITAEQLEQFGRTLMELEADAAGPITYTNRAARRARAKAERKN